MTFCGKVKEEIASVSSKICCKKAGLFGALLFAAEFNENNLRIVTSSPAVTEKITSDMKSLFGFAPELHVTEGKKKTVRILTLSDKQKLSTLLSAFYPKGAERKGINHFLIQNDCDKTAFLRGAFMTGGTVTDPNKSYYLDFTMHSKPLADELMTVFREIEAEPSYILRRGVSVVYFRGSEKIEAVLQMLGAFGSYFDFVNVKIEKEVKNGVNRTLNCDSGNAKRSIAASKKQLKAIECLKKNGRLESLEGELHEIAVIRLANEDMSLEEIGRMCSPPISKTAVYNRLKKIEEIASNGK